MVKLKIKYKYIIFYVIFKLKKVTISLNTNKAYLSFNI